eukprot:scaffold3.g6387.t1
MRNAPERVLAAHLSALDLGAGSAGGLSPQQQAALHSALVTPGLNPNLLAASLQYGAAPAANSRRNEEKVRRTVYISDIDSQATEAQLAAFFSDCGQLVDCRMCGDPNSSMRFAFIEFLSEAAARQAQAMTGSMLGGNPIRVSPSKTAIVPVNNTYLPRSAGEREQVARTVYVANLDKGLETDVVRDYFEGMCGPVSRLRVLGDAQHQTKIAFIEFATALSAEAALKCSGAVLGGLAVRVSPSKTPVRCEQPSRGGGAHGRAGPPPSAAAQQAFAAAQLALQQQQQQQYAAARQAPHHQLGAVPAAGQGLSPGMHAAFLLPPVL